MKLSDAIQLGAMLRPQSFGWYADDRGTCAMGAAMEACDVNGQRAADVWPITLRSPAVCPACPHIILGCDNPLRHATGAMIVHLNDDHRWTREAIADWVAFQEAVDEPASLAAVDRQLVSR